MALLLPPSISLNPSASSQNTVQPTAGTVCPLTLKAASSQSNFMLLFRDASNTPIAGVGAAGSFISKGWASAVNAKTADYTAIGTDFFIPVDATSGPVTITLPLATGGGAAFGQNLRVAKVDTSVNAVTVQRQGSDTINGGTSVVLTSQNDEALFQSNSLTAWLAVVPGVSLAPNTPTRNLVQPTADANYSLILKGHSATQGPLFEVRDSDDSMRIRMLDDANDGTLTIVPHSTISGIKIKRTVPTGNDANYLYCEDDTGKVFCNVGPPDAGILALKNNASTDGINLYLASGPGQTGATFAIDNFDGGNNWVRAFAIDRNQSLVFQQIDSAGGFNMIPQATINSAWADNTHGATKGRLILSAVDFNATREVVRFEADGSSPRIGFLGHIATLKEVNRSGNSITADVTVANTMTETLLYTGSLIANELIAGRNVRVCLYGRMSALVTDTVTLRFKFAGTTFLTVVSTAAAITGQEWSAEFVLTCRTTGATGTVISAAQCVINSLLQDTADTGTHTIDTTVANNITVTAQWSAASSSDTITLQQGFTEVLN